jgi:dolichol kinase
MKHLKEYARQVIHIFIGTLFIILAAYTTNTWWAFLILTLFGLLGIIIIEAFDIGPVRKLLDAYDRPGTYLPGWGALSLLKGFFLTTFLFPDHIAIPALIIFVFGDGLATLLGQHAGVKLPWNTNKTIAGTILGFLIAGIITLPFLGVMKATIAALAGMYAESLRKPRWLDDNILIPLAAAAIIAILP